MNTLIAIFCIVILFDLVKPLFKGQINQSELIEAKLSNSEFRANKRAYR